MSGVPGWLSRLDAFWYAPAPPERLACLRAAVGAFALVYTLIRAPSLVSVVRFGAGQFAPVGPVAWLARPLPTWLVYALTALTVVAGAGFMLGLLYRLSGPLFALLFLWVTSYRSSWGMTFHTENLLSLHLCLLAVSPAAAVLSLDARRRSDVEPAVAHGRYGWAIPRDGRGHARDVFARGHREAAHRRARVGARRRAAAARRLRQPA